MYDPCNWRLNKTPEELAAIAIKSQETRKRNKLLAEEKRKQQELYAGEVGQEIKRLEEKLEKLKVVEKLVSEHPCLPNTYLVSKDDILQHAQEWVTFSGVYFLIENDEVVYIGQSVNVYSRIAHHYSSVRIKFTKFLFISCPPENLDQVESLYIHLLKPPLNANRTEEEKHAPLRMDKLFNFDKCTETLNS